MPIRKRERDGIQILELSGDFILGATGSSRRSPRGSAGAEPGTLKDAIDGLIDGGARRIVIDLERVGSIDSAAVAELVSCKKRTMQAGGDTKLLRPGARVRDLLEVTRLSDVFDVHDDEEAAVGAF